MPKTRIAIIDCGTNTFNLLYGIIQDNKPVILHEEKRVVKLGQGSILTCEFTIESMQRAIDTMLFFAQKIRLWNPDHVFAIATAAFRNAHNANDLINKIKHETDIHIDIISGVEEAQLIYIGAIHNCRLAEPHLVMDIGGGSTEFIFSRHNSIEKCWSFEAGATNLIETLQLQDPASEEELNRIETYLKHLFKPMFDSLPTSIHTLIGTSGFFDSIEHMATARGEGNPVQGHVSTHISLEVFQRLYNEIVYLPLEMRLQIHGLPAFRAELIVPAFVLTKLIIHTFDVSTLITTPYSLKEGKLFSII